MEEKMKRIVVFVLMFLLMVTGTSLFSAGKAEAPAGPIIFASTQMEPAKEQTFARGELLGDFST